MSNNDAHSTVDASIVEKRLDLLEIEHKIDQRRRDSEAANKAPLAKPWWASAIEFLALPAAIVAIVLQLTQASSNVQTSAKFEAETAKLRTDEVKTRVELQRMLDDLAETKKRGITAYREEVEKAIPQLQQTIERLRILEAQSKTVTLERSIAKYVLLWVPSFRRFNFRCDS